MKSKIVIRIISLAIALIIIITLMPTSFVNATATENSATNPIQYSDADKINFPQSPNEGYVLLDKKSEWVPNEKNVAKVTMSLQGKGVKSTTDVVLVIDRSGSMKDILDNSIIYDREVPLTFYSNNVYYESQYVKITGTNASISMTAYVDSNNTFKGYKKGTLVINGLNSSSKAYGNPQYWDPLLIIFKDKKAQATIDGHLVNVAFPTSREVLKNTKRGSTYKKTTKIESAQDAAKEFISTLLATEEMKTVNRIGIVSYSSSGYGKGTVYKDSELSNNDVSLCGAIDNIVADGGTHIQAGIAQAQNMLSSSNANNKYIVVLSDGEPTFSYKATAAKSATADDFALNYPTDVGYKLTEFNSTVLGTGGNYYYNSSDYYYARGDLNHYWVEGYWVTFLGIRLYYVDGYWEDRWVEEYKVKDNGIPTISQALLAKQAGIEIYSVGFDVTGITDAVYTMKNIASSDNNFYLATDDLSQVFTDIAGKILIAGTNAVVNCPKGDNDSIGYYFEILQDSSHQITVSQGVVKVSSDKKALDWDLGTTGTGGDITESPAVLTYYIKLIVTGGTVIENDTLLETGGIASVVYKNYLGNWCKRNFPPAPLTAESGMLIVKYYLSDKDGNAINNKGVIIDFLNRESVAAEDHIPLDLNTEIEVSQYAKAISGYINVLNGCAYDENGNLVDAKITATRETIYLNLPYSVSIVDYFLTNSMYKEPIKYDILNETYYAVEPISSSSSDGSYKISNMLDYTFGFKFIAQNSNPEIEIDLSGLNEQILENYKQSDFKLYELNEDNGLNSLVSEGNTLSALDKTQINYHKTYTITYNLKFNGYVEEDILNIEVKGDNFIDKMDSVKNPLIIMNTGNMPALE